MMKILVIDDEPLARQRLHSVIAELGSNIVVAEGSNGEQAIALCQQHQPDARGSWSGDAAQSPRGCGTSGRPADSL